jgi:hypothetical protein
LDGLPGKDPARFDITTVEAENGTAHARRQQLVHLDLIIFALNQQISPADAPAATVGIGARRRQRSGADQIVHVDPILGLILKGQGFLAHKRRAGLGEVGVEHPFARKA